MYIRVFVPPLGFGFLQLVGLHVVLLKIVSQQFDSLLCLELRCLLA